jgi:mannitol/fructose-specific phosphotransferase system IIA component (Ntr-type)
MTPPAANLLAYFHERRFIPALRAKSKAGVLKELAVCMAENGDIRHPDLLLDAMLSREKLGSTAIGKEVAIPHSRTLSVPNLVALVARSKAGVDWGAADEKPVKLFFLVVAPPQERQNTYLPLLGALVSAMQRKKDRDRILAAKDFADVESALAESFRG